MKKLILALCYLGVSLWVLAQPGPAPENVILTARATRTIQYGGPTRAEGRSYNFTPVFFIYPDGKLDKAGAEALLRELDIQSLLDSEYGTALVINPVGDKYVADADFDAFVNLFNASRGPGNLTVGPAQRGQEVPKQLWYEYWPEELLEDAPEHSVPVMVLLHGNQNDPRTQAETSGFIQVAAEGLSAGSITATALGIKKSHVFTAVGGHSGGIFGGPFKAYSTFDVLWAEATQKRGAVEVPYCSVFGTKDNVVPYIKPDDWKNNNYLNAWNAYEQMNGMEVVREMDFSIDPVFAQELQDRETIVTNKGDGIVIETGQLYKGDVPMIKLVAVMDYGHWNFQPTARIMWDFFSHYRRDPETKKLVYLP